MGPEKVGLMALTFLRNFNMPMGENGTPKSGQLVKWSWETGLGVLAASLACWTQTETKTQHFQMQGDAQRSAREPEFWFLGSTKEQFSHQTQVEALTYWMQNFRMV